VSSHFVSSHFASASASARVVHGICGGLAADAHRRLLQFVEQRNDREALAAMARALDPVGPARVAASAAAVSYIFVSSHFVFDKSGAAVPNVECSSSTSSSRWL
jgi:hypothetical protein